MRLATEFRLRFACLTFMCDGVCVQSDSAECAQKLAHVALSTAYQACDPNGPRCSRSLRELPPHAVHLVARQRFVTASDVSVQLLGRGWERHSRDLPFFSIINVFCTGRSLIFRACSSQWQSSDCSLLRRGWAHSRVEPRARTIRPPFKKKPSA